MERRSIDSIAVCDSRAINVSRVLFAKIKGNADNLGVNYLITEKGKVLEGMPLSECSGEASVMLEGDYTHGSKKRVSDDMARAILNPVERIFRQGHSPKNISFSDAFNKLDVNYAEAEFKALRDIYQEKSLQERVA